MRRRDLRVSQVWMGRCHTGRTALGFSAAHGTGVHGPLGLWTVADLRASHFTGLCADEADWTPSKELDN